MKQLPPESAGWWQHDMEPAPSLWDVVEVALSILRAVCAGALVVLLGLVLAGWSYGTGWVYP